MSTESLHDPKPGFLIAPPARPASFGRDVARAAPRLLLGAVFLAAGGMKLAATEFEVNGFARFGYAPWFMYLIGALETAGGIMLLIPALAGAGALLLAPVMAGAAWSHLAAGDGVAAAAPALVLLAALLALAWARRRAILPRRP